MNEKKYCHYNITEYLLTRPYQNQLQFYLSFDQFDAIRFDTPVNFDNFNRIHFYCNAKTLWMKTRRKLRGTGSKLNRPDVACELQLPLYQKLIDADFIDEFTTCTNPIIHRFYSPKICIGIIFDFSWVIFMSQEKLQTMVMQKS